MGPYDASKYKIQMRPKLELPPCIPPFTNQVEVSILLRIWLCGETINLSSVSAQPAGLCWTTMLQNTDAAAEKL